MFSTFFLVFGNAIKQVWSFEFDDDKLLDQFTGE